MIAEEVVPRVGLARRVVARSGRRRYVGAWLSVGFLVALVGASIFAPLPHNPFDPIASATLKPPSLTYWFGTDGDGLDVFSRTILAARTDITLAVVGSVLSLCIGVPIGLFASYPSVASSTLMRAMDVLQALPLLVVAIVIVSLTGASSVSIVAAIALTSVPVFIRFARAEASVVRSRRYIEAAVASGGGRIRVAFRHVLPNITNVILPQLALSASGGLLLIAGLGFLGIGVSPPAASWGELVSEGASYIVDGAWWISLFPGIFILLSILAFNAISDGIYLWTVRSRSS